MKTKIIQLERYDDVMSVTDKINWGSANRVLLVWPQRGHVLRRSLDLLLVLRACQRIGVQLACVAEDPDILDHAQELGIPVFRSAAVAQRLPWRRSRRKKIFEPRPLSPRSSFDEKKAAHQQKSSSFQNNSTARWVFFGLGLAAVAAVVLFTLPGASIQLTPMVENQSVDIVVRASPDFPAVNLAGQIPIEIKTVIVEGQDKLAATGSVTVPLTAATGSVVFGNLGEKAVSIPVGTIVQTNRDPVIRFETLTEATLPARIGSKVESQIRAIQAGSIGNVSTGEINAVVGAVGANIIVTNPAPITGGGDQLSRSPSQGDFQMLRDRMIEAMRQNALSEILKNDENEVRVFPETLSIRRVINEHLFPEIGIPGDQLTLSLSIEFEVWSAKENDIASIGQIILDANIPERAIKVSGTYRYEDLTQPMVSEKTVTWKVRASQDTRMGWDDLGLTASLAGKTPIQAEKILAEAVPDAKKPVISTAPAWWPFLPLIPGRIRITIE